MPTPRTLLHWALLLFGAAALFVGAGIASNVVSDAMSRRTKHDLIVRQSQELERVSTGNKAIEAIMASMLRDIPRITQVRVSVLHNGTNTLTASPILFIDNLFAASNPGWSAGDLQSNVAISRWSAYLDDLRAARCVYRQIAEVTDPSDGNRWKQLGIRASVICPLLNSEGRLMGAVFANWHDNVMPPTPEELTGIMDRVQRGAKGIAVAFELRIPSD